MLLEFAEAGVQVQVLAGMYVGSLGTFVEENGGCFIDIFIGGLSNGAGILFLFLLLLLYYCPSSRRSSARD